MPIHGARAGRCALALLWTCALTACGELPARKPVRNDEALLSQLGFLRGDRADRRLIEARLGEPMARYEGGRVVSYAVYSSKGRLTLQPGGDCFALMIEYDPDEAMARHELIRYGSAHCRK